MEGGDTRQAGPSSPELVPGLWALGLSREADEPANNGYLLAEDDGFVLIDPGWASPLAERNLAAIVGRIGFELGQLKLVLCTHCHPDHYGMAPALSRQTGCATALHGADAAMIGVDELGFVSRLARWRSWLVDAGVPDAELLALQGDNRFVRRTYTAALPTFLVEDNQDLPLANWRIKVIHAPGHSAGHVCFFEHRHRLLFTGDALFAAGRTTISSYPGAAADPVNRHRESLRRLRAYEARLALPGPGEPFADVDERIAAELAAIDADLDRAETILLRRGAATVWQVAVDAHQVHWAGLAQIERGAILTQTAALLEALAADGRVEREGEAPWSWRGAPEGD